MPTTPTKPRQQSIPGTEPDHPEIAAAIERWLELQEAAKRAREKAGEADDAIVVKMQELGCAYYPYTDPETGKRKYRVVDTTPRGKSISARPQPQESTEPDEPEVSEDSPVDDTRVEHRKVSRSKAQKAIAEEKQARKKRTEPDVGEWRTSASGDDE